MKTVRPPSSNIDEEAAEREKSRRKGKKEGESEAPSCSLLTMASAPSPLLAVHALQRYTGTAKRKEAVTVSGWKGIEKWVGAIFALSLQLHLALPSLLPMRVLAPSANSFHLHHCIRVTRRLQCRRSRWQFSPAAPRHRPRAETTLHPSRSCTARWTGSAHRRTG